MKSKTRTITRDRNKRSIRLKGGKYKRKKVITRRRKQLKPKRFKKSNKNKMNMLAKKTVPHTGNI
tara:strand:- start:6445 stop:6639 length:195 start_codon:yes stop_codon:yes gene_type:complete